MRFLHQALLILLILLCRFQVELNGQEQSYPAPIIKDCLDQENPTECTNWGISNFLTRHFKYPAIARENGLEGTILLRVTIGKTGIVDTVKILHLPGEVFRKSTEKIVERLYTNFEWKPAVDTATGQPVKTEITVPIYATLSTKGLPKLRDLEFLVCQRQYKFDRFVAKPKQVSKMLTKNELDPQDFWLYQLTSRELIGIQIEFSDLLLQYYPETNSRLKEKLMNLEKGDIIDIHFLEALNDVPQYVSKRILIK